MARAAAVAAFRIQLRLPHGELLPVPQNHRGSDDDPNDQSHHRQERRAVAEHDRDTAGHLPIGRLRIRSEVEDVWIDGEGIPPVAPVLGRASSKTPHLPRPTSPGVAADVIRPSPTVAKLSVEDRRSGLSGSAAVNSSGVRAACLTASHES